MKAGKSNGTKRYQSITQMSPFAIMTFSLSGYVTSCNPATTELTEYTQDEIIGKHVSQLPYFNKDTIKLGLEILVDVVKGKSLDGVEFPYTTKSGEHRWARGWIKLVKHNDGKKECLTIIQDITEEEKLKTNLKEEREKYQNLVDFSLDGILVIQDTIIRYANDETARILGYNKADAIINTSILDYTHEDYKEQIREWNLLRQLGEPTPNEYDELVVTKQGETRTVQAKVSQISWEGNPASLSFIRDVTEARELSNQLKASEAEKRAILTFTPDTISLKDEDYHYVWVNKTLSDILGLTEDEIRGKVCYKLTRNLEEPCSFCAVKDSNLSGETQRRTIEFIDGTLRDIAYIPIIYPDGRKLTLEIGREITEQVDFGRKLESLQYLVSELGGKYDIGEASDIVVDAVSRVLDYKRIGLFVVEDGFLKALSSRPRKTLEKIRLTGKGVIVRAVRTKSPQLVPDVRNDPDYISVEASNEAKTLSKYAIPILVGGEVVALLNIESSRPDVFSTSDLRLIDIIVSHIKSVFERIHYVEREKSLLSQLIEERIRVEKAVELERLKTRFVSNATHELRTPLTIMKGYLELALDEDDFDSMRHLIEVAYRNTERLESLTNDLLDQQRIEEGRLELNKETIDLDKFLRGIVEEASSLLDEKNQNLRVFKHFTFLELFCDRVRIGQVLFNLLSNASKYSPRGSKVTVSVDVLDDVVQFSVSDEGCGFTEDEMKELFKPFPDIEHPVVTEKSVGLGLSICKGIVELHGGRIWAESEGRDKGSKFYFTIPITT